MVADWSRWIDGELDAVRDRGQWRSPRVFDGRGVRGQVDGRPVVTYASNDYLGLTGHPAVRAAASAAAAEWGTGSGASRLVVGSRPVHDELEQALAAWKGTEQALHFSTGYAANLSVLATLGGPGADRVREGRVALGIQLALRRGGRATPDPANTWGALAPRAHQSQSLRLIGET